MANNIQVDPHVDDLPDDILEDPNVILDLNLFDEMTLEEVVSIDVMYTLYYDIVDKFLETHDSDPKYLITTYTSIDSIKLALFHMRQVLITEYPEQYLDAYTFSESG